VTVSDVSGRIVEQRSINSGGLIQFSLNDEPAGLYFIQVITTEQHDAMKLVKE
jgi:hypothetical protein